MDIRSGVDSVGSLVAIAELVRRALQSWAAGRSRWKPDAQRRGQRIFQNGTLPLRLRAETHRSLIPSKGSMESSM